MRLESKARLWGRSAIVPVIGKPEQSALRQCHAPSPATPLFCHRWQLFAAPIQATATAPILSASHVRPHQRCRWVTFFSLSKKMQRAELASLRPKARALSKPNGSKCARAMATSRRGIMRDVATMASGSSTV